MRSLFLLILLALPVCAGCSKDSDRPRNAVALSPGAKQDQAPTHGQAEAPGGFVMHQDAKDQPKGGVPEEKKEKPRKIRYTADMKLIVKSIDDAEEALDAARKEAKGDYERAEVNRSANTIRSGTWRIRVPNENLNSFRKAVAKIGDVERDTIESEDMTAKYYDLEAHIANRKAEQTAIRDFLIEIGKKDARYLEVKRELDNITDDIMRKEGTLKLWTNLTDLTTFTVHMREKQTNDPAPLPTVAPPPAPFDERASKTWSGSWDLFVGFVQGIALVAIALSPWLPIPLIGAMVLWIVVRLTRSPKPAVVAAMAAPAEPKT
jgi:hypothetical protein